MAKRAANAVADDVHAFSHYDGRQRSSQGLYLVMPSRGNKEDYLALVEDRCDDCDVRQVAAASQLWVIAD